MNAFLEDSQNKTANTVYVFIDASNLWEAIKGKHKFFIFLNKGLGFAVIKKELKRISVLNEHGEAIEEKGNMDVEITIDVLHHFKKYDTAVFFTGDSDFLALVTYLKNHGKKVFIFSSKNNISQ